MLAMTENRADFMSTDNATMQNLATIVEGLCSGSIRRIAVLSGAGISTAAGIPDFRSPGGLYSKLRPELLTATKAQRHMMEMDPTCVVSYDIFSQNQFPYLEVRRPFIIGTFQKQWKPTLAHYFFRLLSDKGLLRRLYTQNIDGLHLDTGVPESKLVHVHGSLAKIKCEFCHSDFPHDEFLHHVRTKIRNIYDPSDVSTTPESHPLNCHQCHQPGVKPDTVLFGRQLPRAFFHCVTEDFPNEVDLLIVIGTSLVVHPANGLPDKVLESTPRLFINKDDLPVSMRPNDVFLKMSCDDAVMQLLSMLEWKADMVKYKDDMCDQSSKLLDHLCCDEHVEEHSSNA